MNLNPAPENWVKSSYSSPEGGNCLEWAPSYTHTHHFVPVRDSKVSHGPVLVVSVQGWRDFVAHV
ncbi:DUF397 domain-containing protein [Streptomyces sp. NPDC051217]|uniref:DUF397 domain-containing protein n=1 Tax=Streptomyces sp. NPDC051217 TaxID=3365644 RepID=UPI00379B6946